MSDTSSLPSRQKDDPQLGLVPRFTQPTPEEPETEAPAENPDTTAGIKAGRPYPPVMRLPWHGGGGNGRLEPSTPASDAPRAAPTGSSSEARTVDVTEATALVLGVLGVVVTVAAGVVRWRSRRRLQLREPTKQQRRDIAGPLAKILMRRADLSMLGPDIGDALQAAAAVGAYVGDGPLITPGTASDPNIPADLQEHPS